MRPEPAEQAAGARQRGDFEWPRAAQREAAAIEQRQLGGWFPEQIENCGHQPGRQQAAEHALERAEIVERTADERIGGADHACQLDLGGTPDDLQTDGVERGGDQPGCKDAGEYPQRQPRQPQQRVETLDPGRVELHMRHLRPAGDLLAQDLERFRCGVGRLDHEGVRQRVARQAGDDFGHALAFLQALQRLLLRHEAPLAGRRLAQAALDVADLLARGVGSHVQADLLHTRGVAAEVAQIVEKQVADARQRQCDADDEQRKQRVERRRPQPAHGQRECCPVLGEPGAHESTSLP